MARRMCTWRELITEEMRKRGESWGDVVAMTLTEEQLDVVFDADFGSPCGAPFTLWTQQRVYFPTSYDGWEDAASVPRNPSDEAVEHVGNS